MAQVVGISYENWPRKWPNTSWAWKQVAQNEAYCGDLAAGKCEHMPPAAGHNSRRVGGQQLEAEVAAAGVAAAGRQDTSKEGETIWGRLV
jgi:hypothetical protein